MLTSIRRGRTLTSRRCTRRMTMSSWNGRATSTSAIRAKNHPKVGLLLYHLHHFPHITRWPSFASYALPISFLRAMLDAFYRPSPRSSSSARVRYREMPLTDASLTVNADPAIVMEITLVHWCVPFLSTTFHLFGHLTTHHAPTSVFHYCRLVICCCGMQLMTRNNKVMKPSELFAGVCVHPPSGP